MILEETEIRDRHERYSEPVRAEVGTVCMHVESGSVDIRSHDLPSVDVDAHLRGVDVHVWREDDCVFVTAENAPLEADQAAVPRKAEIVVLAPATCDVQVQVVTGSVEIHDVSAAVRSHIITGQTALSNIGGRIVASAVTGSISYQGRLVDDTHRFAATTGSLRLALQEPPNARIYAWSTTGRVLCELPLSQSRRGGLPTGDHLYGVTGSGVGRILAEVTTGSVHIAAM